jgi:RNA polymerase sigma factor (sigma-70 family)
MSSEEACDDEVAAFYRKSAPKVLGFLVGIGCDGGLAEEITDDAFLGARRYWTHVRTLDEPEGYVFKIARNERSKRQKKHDDRAKELHPDPSETARDVNDDPAQQVADRAMIQHALQQLPPQLQETVVLRDIGDLSEAMTAEIMGISIGTVKSYTSVGRARLRLLLDEFRSRKEGMTDDRR